MTAQIANGAKACGACSRQIQAGEALYLVTKFNMIRCEDCARRVQVGPLPEPQIIERPKPRPQSFGRFQNFSMRRTLRQNMVDYRAKAAGVDV